MLKITTTVRATFENGLTVRARYSVDGPQALEDFRAATAHLGPIAGQIKAKTDWLIIIESGRTA